MSTRRSRIASFRNSVITVVAAFAPLSGCSLDHGTGTKKGVDPSECQDGGASGCVPACPNALPQRDSECPSEGQDCAYEFCGDPSGTHATCKDGQWQVGVSSCNPPAQTCPSVLPGNGTPCFVEELSCSYPDDCAGTNTTCVDGLWQVHVTPCNPPENVCPEQQPTDGDPCSMPSSEECTYGSCGNLPKITASCVASVWRISESPCNPEGQCPTDVPEKGAACSGEFGENQTCIYGDCAQGPAFTAICAAEGWQLTPNTCNPPPLVMCPAEVPKADTGCEVPADQACKYGPCGGTVATCPAGVWTIALIDLDCPPHTTTCPATLPTSDTLCNYEGDPCPYSEGGHQYSAQCVDSKWSINDFGFPD